MMYNDLKAFWNAQYRLSANKSFAEFRRNIACGGLQAKDFIENNPDLAETILGGEDAVEDVLASIRKDREVAENQVYFFKQTTKLLPEIRTLLARKYAATIRYCKQVGIPTDGLTAENILPEIRRSEERGNDPDQQDDSNPDVENRAETQSNAEVGIPTSPETVNSTEEIPEESNTNEPTDGLTAENIEENAPVEHDAQVELKHKIEEMYLGGSSKSEIWQAASDLAKLVKWTSRDVWAYIDEIEAKN